MLKRIYDGLIRRSHTLIQEVFPAYFCRSKRAAGLYYLLFSRTFSREQMAVLAGRAHYNHEQKHEKTNFYLLVRNVHRLEKGLILSSDRKVFGRDYIAETVEAYIGIKNSGRFSESEQLKWAEDVLTTYFSKVSADSFIKIQEKSFLEARGATSFEAKLIPYLRNFENRSSVSYDEFLKLSHQRRSVRFFLDKKVPGDLIDKAITAALQSPSACNRQPFHFKICDAPELVQQVMAIPMGTRGYAESVYTVAVVIGCLDAYFHERDRHLIYVDAALAAMSFMYALETLGLSSCPINWPDIEQKEKEMTDLLQLEIFQRPVMLIAFGYPDESKMVARSQKRSLETARSFN